MPVLSLPLINTKPNFTVYIIGIYLNYKMDWESSEVVLVSVGGFSVAVSAELPTTWFYIAIGRQTAAWSKQAAYQWL